MSTVRFPADLAADSPLGKYRRAMRPDGLASGPPRSANPAAQLAGIKDLRAMCDDLEAEIVFALRLHGSSWQDIANVTGMESRQAAQYRYEQSAGLIDRLAQATSKPTKP